MLANRKITVGEVEIFTDGKYCNHCKFRKYINNQIKHVCLLFGEKPVRDGSNFIRLEKCQRAEVADNG